MTASVVADHHLEVGRSLHKEAGVMYIYALAEPSYLCCQLFAIMHEQPDCRFQTCCM